MGTRAFRTHAARFQYAALWAVSPRALAWPTTRAGRPTADRNVLSMRNARGTGPVRMSAALTRAREAVAKWLFALWSTTNPCVLVSKAPQGTPLRAVSPCLQVRSVKYLGLHFWLCSHALPDIFFFRFCVHAFFFVSFQVWC